MSYNISDITMNVIGDSITYGTYVDAENNYIVMDKPWCSLVSEKLGFVDVKNFGINGTSISSMSSVLSEKAISLRYGEMSDDANLIVVAGGANDFGTNVRLGTKEDTTDVSFYGALHVLCDGLKNKYPSATIVFITPIHRIGEKNKNGNTINQYREAIKDVVRDIYGFYVIDGEDPDLINYMHDGIHPTPDGHRVLADYFAKKLSDILC